MQLPALPQLQALLRAVIAVGGGYALTALAVNGGAVLLARAGLAPSDAVVTAAMLGFLAYLGLLLWALACASLVRLSAWLGGAILLVSLLAGAAA